MPEGDDYHPAHAAADFRGRAQEICGWTEFTSKPGWDNDFTVAPTCGAIDLAYASREVLRALGIPDDFVDRFLQVRQGPDGIDGTADDGQLDQQAAFAMLGLNKRAVAASKGIQNPVVFQNPNAVFRILSAGKSRGVTRSVEMVVQKQVIGIGRPQVFGWDYENRWHPGLDIKAPSN